MISKQAIKEAKQIELKEQIEREIYNDIRKDVEFAWQYSICPYCATKLNNPNLKDIFFRNKKGLTCPKCSKIFIKEVIYGLIDYYQYSIKKLEGVKK